MFIVLLREHSLLNAWMLGRDDSKKSCIFGKNIPLYASTKKTLTYIMNKNFRSQTLSLLVLLLLPFTTLMGQGNNDLLIRSSIINVMSGVMQALDKGAKIDCKDGNGRTPLMLASKLGHTPLVIIFLDRGANKEAKDQNGQTALSHACSNNQVDALRVLLEQGADPESKAKNGKTGLMLAAENGYHDVMGLLLEKGAKPSFTLEEEIEVAASSGDFNTDLVNGILTFDEKSALLALENGASADHRTKRSIPVLILASARSQVAVVNALLEKGADVNIRASYAKGGVEQVTALHVAATKGHEAIVGILIGNGAKVDAQEKTGLTPLMSASEQGHVVPAILLIDKGADPNMQDYAGNSPLLLAVANNHLDLARILIDKGSDVDLADAEFTTPLMLAAQYGYRDMVELLVKAGANPKLRRGNNGYRAVDFARVSGNKEIVQLLK